MRRSLFILLAVLVFISGASAEQRFSLGVDAGYFHPRSGDFRDIYGSGIQLGAELTVDFGNGITAWAGGRYFRKTGQLSFTGEAVVLHLLPLHLGLGYQFRPGGLWRPFLGGGVSLNVFREAAPLETIKQTRLGYWGQAGISIRIMRRLALEAKCVYNSCRMEFPETDVDLSGMSGIIGLKFLLKD